MSKQNEAIKTITVAGLLCFVCSILVSIVVVTLRPQQAKNAELDLKKNILMSAGLIEEGGDIEATFSTLETVLINFNTGDLIKLDTEEKKKYFANFDMVSAAKSPATSEKIPANIDVGGLSTRSKIAKGYVRRDGAGKIDTIILNVWGKGLWSTMYGFIALSADTKTIKGFAYYSQGETPGLGGEVDNPNWKNQWISKKLYDENFNVAFAVNKGTVDHTHNLAQYRVDGISGATITANGVTSSVKYWFGDHGYAKFLAKVRAGEI